MVFSRLIKQFPFYVAHAASAAVLFEHGTIIGYDEGAQDFQIFTNASMLIENDRITKLVNESTIDNVPYDTTKIDATGKIISPGFINTHTHLWQTAYKTLGSNTTLAEYFQRYGEFGPAEQNFTPEDIYLGQLTGALEQIHVGTTTVLDHAHGDFSTEGAHAEMNGTLESGLRTVYAHAVHPIPNGWPMEEQIALFDVWAKDTRITAPSSRVSVGLAFDFFFQAPESNVSALWSAVQSHNLSVVTTHYLGGPWGIINSPTKLQSYGWLNSSVPVVFSHASFPDQTDYQILRSTNQYISTTPESEQHYGHTHPWSHLIQDQASLGVDTHFTFSPSMVQQARSWLQSLREREDERLLIDYYNVPRTNPASVKQAFYLATRAGGLALRRGHELGIIKEGAKADVVVFDGTSPNMLGWWDPIAAVVLHSDVGDIEHVLIDGQFAKKNGKLVYKDYTGLQGRFLKTAKKIQNIWLNTKWEPLQGSFADTGEFADIRTLDTLRGPGTGY